MKSRYVIMFIFCIFIFACQKITYEFNNGDIVIHKVTRQKGIIINQTSDVNFNKKYIVRMYNIEKGSEFSGSGAFVLGIGGASAESKISNGYFEMEFMEFELEKCNKE